MNIIERLRHIQRFYKPDPTTYATLEEAIQMLQKEQT